ncbi:MAG: hypothetical protein HC913_09015 [Microscillaceae bacterium]|nr:hypothetical protein [Microscillaceae bacterium]
MNKLNPSKPLSNLQSELLKLYSTNISEQTLLEIKGMLSQYFAQRAVKQMDELWEKKQWNDETMENWLNDPQQ